MYTNYEYDGYIDHMHKVIKRKEQYKDSITLEQMDKQMNYKQMTREEAKNKCWGIKYPEAFVQALEALGLIKFEEEKIDYIKEAKNWKTSPINIENIINELLKELEKRPKVGDMVKVDASQYYGATATIVCPLLEKI